MKKRYVILSFLLLLTAMILPYPHANSEKIAASSFSDFMDTYGQCGLNAMWSYANHTLTISGAGTMDDYSNLDVHAPWYDYKDSVTTIIIQKGITSIGSNAFMDFHVLQHVSISNSVNTIGSHAFNGCTQLSELTLPSELQTIGYGAFYCCTHLSELSIPGKVSLIGQNAFAGCVNIQFVSFPDALNEIRTDAFEGCNSITDIFYSGNYSNIVSIVFSQGNSSLKKAIWHCNDITSYLQPTVTGSCGNTAYWKLIDDTLVIYGSGKMDSYSDLSVHAPWYDWKDYITEATIEPGITSIGDSAFINCRKLRRISLPDGIVSIGTHAFNCCSNLEQIKLPSSVYTISYGAFYCCSSITAIDIPDKVITLGQSSFAGCSSLEQLSLPASIKNISIDAFSSCAKLTNVYYAGKFEDVSVISIELGNMTLKQALWHCADKTALLPLPLNGSCGTNSFWNISGEKLTIYGTGEMDSYSGLSEHAPWYDWKDIITEVHIEPGITSVGGYSFIRCSNLQRVFLPDGLKSIGTHAFNCCFQLESVSLPSSVESIGYGSFYCCSSLAYMAIPEGVTSIGQSAFAGCFSLTEISLPSSLVRVDIDAFSSCRQLKDVYYAANSEQAYQVQMQPGSISLLDASWHYNEIGTSIYSFSNALYFPSSLIKIEEDALRGTHPLAVIIPNGCLSIESKAFVDNAALKYVLIPSTVTNIADDAFDIGQDIIILGDFRSAAKSFATTHGFQFMQF